MDRYLESSDIINWKHPDVTAQARTLASNCHKPIDVARVCFEFVRDEIRHSNDYQLNPVTCVASDVLQYKTGYCYAKSHLLAALLRANNIPAGLCYQRLTVDNDTPPFCLHGLNAVYLKEFGWYRIDARGNKEGINARFSPPTENLAFPIITKGEADLKEIWPEPLPDITHILSTAKDYKEVADNLPDIELASV